MRFSDNWNTNKKNENGNFARTGPKLRFSSEEAIYTWHRNEAEGFKKDCMDSAFKATKSIHKPEQHIHIQTHAMKNEMDQENTRYSWFAV